VIVSIDAGIGGRNEGRQEGRREREKQDE